MAKAQPAPRQQRILRAVVHEYIRTAQPVSSDTLVRRYRLGVSSATVRNDLAALEDLGPLTHPHTSAGRIPTQHGYRYFIGSLMGDSRLGQSEQMMVRHQFHQVHLDTAEWSRLAASVLARLSIRQLHDIDRVAPRVTAKFSANLARNLSGRLRRANEQVRMLAH